MKRGDHGCLCYAGYQAFIYRHCCRDAKLVAIQAPFAKEMVRSQDRNYGFLSLLGNHPEPALPPLNVKDRVSDVALREDNLSLLILVDRFSLADLGKKFPGIERTSAFLHLTTPLARSGLANSNAARLRARRTAIYLKETLAQGVHLSDLRFQGPIG